MQRLARLSLTRPGLALALLAAVTAVLGAGLPRLTTDVGYRALLGHDHPAIARFDAFLEQFAGGFPLAAVWSCAETDRCDSVFDADALEMAAAAVAALEGEPSVRRVESPATAPLWVPSDGDPVVLRLIDAAPDERAWLATRALRDSLWPRQLVSQDGTVGAIVVEVASSSSADNTAAWDALERALSPHEARGYRFHRVGGPVEFVVAGGELAADTARLVPAMVALIAVVLLALFGSPAPAAAALASTGVSVLWTLGLMGWLGWPQNSVTQALAPLLLVIGVCDAIHVLARVAEETAASPGRSRADTLVAVAGDVGPACVFTSLTTAAAFASFATSGIGSFVRFGWIAAAGVLFALVLTFTLLPILAVRIGAGRAAGPAAARARRAFERSLDRALDLAMQRPGAVLAAAAVIAGVAAVGITRLRVDASFEDLYGEGSRVVRWSRFVGENLRRPDTLEVVLHAPRGADPADPEVLGVVERVEASLAEVPGLGPALSLADAVALGYQLGNDDDPFWRRLPGRAEDARRVLDALEELQPDALRHFADLDARRFRVSVESEKLAQDAMRKAFAEVETRLADELPDGWSAELTGPLAVVHDMIDEIQRTQLESFAGAGAVVLLLSALFLRSVPAALLAAVPTLLPVLVTVGAMGLAGVSLDVGSAMVAAIVVGIAVDDALHLLAQYRRRRRDGEPAAGAMHAAARHVGRAVVTTSGALAIGFASLAISSWQTISHFGVLSSVAILLALLSVLLVLPALVAVAGREGG